MGITNPRRMTFTDISLTRIEIYHLPIIYLLSFFAPVFEVRTFKCLLLPMPLDRLNTVPYGAYYFIDTVTFAYDAT